MVSQKSSSQSHSTSTQDSENSVSLLKTHKTQVFVGNEPADVMDDEDEKSLNEKTASKRNRKYSSSDSDSDVEQSKRPRSGVRAVRGLATLKNADVVSQLVQNSKTNSQNHVSPGRKATDSFKSPKVITETPRQSQGPGKLSKNTVKESPVLPRAKSSQDQDEDVVCVDESERNVHSEKKGAALEEDTDFIPPTPPQKLASQQHMGKRKSGEGASQRIDTQRKHKEFKTPFNPVDHKHETEVEVLANQETQESESLLPQKTINSRKNRKRQSKRSRKSVSYDEEDDGEEVLIIDPEDRSIQKQLDEDMRDTVASLDKDIFSPESDGDDDDDHVQQQHEKCTQLDLEKGEEKTCLATVIP